MGMHVPLRLHHTCVVVISIQCKHSMFCRIPQGKAVALFFLNATFFCLQHLCAPVADSLHMPMGWRMHPVVGPSRCPLGSSILPTLHWLRALQCFCSRRKGYHERGRAVERQCAECELKTMCHKVWSLKAPRRTGWRVKLTSSLCSS